MGRRYKIGYWILASLTGLSNITTAQGIKSATASLPVLKTGHYNFKTFTSHTTSLSSQWLTYNKDYRNSPDANFITPDNPANTIELFSKRTARSRYFINKDTAAKFYMLEADRDINYLRNGQWLSIDTRLCDLGNKQFEASHQEEPVGFDANGKTAYIKTLAGTVRFNDWELVGENGTDQKILGIANWTNITVGDDGVKITNIFPGIDAEMIVAQGSIKTSFIVRENLFKGYERLIFTDQFKMNGSSTLAFSAPEIGRSIGVDLLQGQKKILHIDAATMFNDNGSSFNSETLGYRINEGRLSMLVDETDLETRLISGPVTIDPQVTSADSIKLTDIGGSMNNGSLSNYCGYFLNMKTPAKATFTNVEFQFGFTSNAPAVNSMGFAAIGLGGCNTPRIGADPSDTAYNKSGFASTMGQWNDLSAFLLSCMPPPSCTPQDVRFTLEFFNDATFGPDNVCSNEYISPHEAFKILLVGETLELNSVSPAVTICQGTGATIQTTGRYGVPPYTYSWDNGAGTDSSTVVSPATTTTYTATITDQCANKVTGSTRVTVIPSVTPTINISSSDTNICVGAPVIFTAAATNQGSAPVYEWLLNGSNVGTNSTTYTNNTLVNNDQISCVLFSNATCKTKLTDTSNIITMTVNTPVTPAVSITASVNGVCGETPVIFTAIPVNTGSAPSYQWQVSGLNKGPDDSLYTNDSLVNGDIVDCIVTVSKTGCYTSSTATSNSLIMSIKAIPGITLTATDTVIAKGKSSTLNAAITGGYTSFSWTPTTALSDPSVTNPVATPIVSTLYHINITDTDGCVKTDSILIAVYDPIFIPNAFTPGATINNIFRVPPTISFDLSDFVVYNRWGTKIFETNDITQGWDGTYQGNKCDADSYVYIITGSNAKGKVFLKGSVTLFR